MLEVAVCDDEPYMQEELKENIGEFLSGEKIEANITLFSDGRVLLENEKNGM